MKNNNSLSFFEIFVAFRHLRSQRSARVISFITLITVAGVTVGVTALIFVLSVMNGLRIDLREKILGLSAHATIASQEGAIIEYEDLSIMLNEMSEIKSAVPFVRQEALLAGFNSAAGVIIKGISPEDLAQRTELNKYMRDGSLDQLTVPPPFYQLGMINQEQLPGIILGRELALNLGIWHGEGLSLISPSGELTPAGFVPKVDRYQVVGVFKSGMYQQDATLAFVTLDSATKFFDLGHTVDGIELRFHNFENAAAISKKVAGFIGPEYKVTSWEESNRNLFSAMKLEKLAMFVILILTVLVASFNIVATLIMMVVEKKREVAIFKAMGASSGSIRRIFQLEGVLIGAIGTLIGAILGVTLTVLADRYQLVPVPTAIYMDHLPIRLIPLDVAIICGSSMLISLLATVYPSSKASNMDPSQALRYE
jgi:lipoprotein-releasing system permease protein